MTGARGAGRSRGGTRRLRTPGSVPSWWEPPPADRFGRRAPRAGRPDPAPADRGSSDSAPARRHAGGGHRRAGPGPARRLVLAGLATALLAPVLGVGLGHLLVDVPVTDRPVVDRVALVWRELVAAGPDPAPDPERVDPVVPVRPAAPRDNALHDVGDGSDGDDDPLVDPVPDCPATPCG